MVTEERAVGQCPICREETYLCGEIIGKGQYGPPWLIAECGCEFPKGDWERVNT